MIHLVRLFGRDVERVQPAMTVRITGCLLTGGDKRLADVCVVRCSGGKRHTTPGANRIGVRTHHTWTGGAPESPLQAVICCLPYPGRA